MKKPRRKTPPDRANEPYRCLDSGGKGLTPKKRKRPKHRHIQRMDYQHVQGWWVRFQRYQKIAKSKLFSDGKHGGKGKSLKAAIAWRDATLPTLPPLPERGYFRTCKRNITGTVGVNYQQYLRKKKYLVEQYSITWFDPVTKVQAHRGRSCRKYGRRVAYRMALEIRRKALARIKAYYRTQKT